MVTRKCPVLATVTSTDVILHHKNTLKYYLNSGFTNEALPLYKMLTQADPYFNINELQLSNIGLANFALML